MPTAPALPHRNPDRRRRRHPPGPPTAPRSPSSTKTRSTPSPATTAARRRLCPGPPARNRPGRRTAADRLRRDSKTSRSSARAAARPDNNHQRQPIRLPLLVAERCPARLPRTGGENDLLPGRQRRRLGQPLAADRPGPERRTARRVLVTRRHPARLPGPLLRRLDPRNTNEVYIANANGSGSVTPLTPDQATPPALSGDRTRSPTPARR